MRTLCGNYANYANRIRLCGLCAPDFADGSYTPAPPGHYVDSANEKGYRSVLNVGFLEGSKAGVVYADSGGSASWPIPDVDLNSNAVSRIRANPQFSKPRSSPRAGGANKRRLGGQIPRCADDSDWAR